MERLYSLHVFLILEEWIKYFKELELEESDANVFGQKFGFIFLKNTEDMKQDLAELTKKKSILKTATNALD